MYLPNEEGQQQPQTTTTTIKVIVTPEDIKEAEKCRGVLLRPLNCPIAFALTRQFGGIWSVGSVTAIHYLNPIKIYNLSIEARNFIFEFDSGFYLKTDFSFTISEKEEI